MESILNELSELLVKSVNSYAKSAEYFSITTNCETTICDNKIRSCKKMKMVMMKSMRFLGLTSIDYISGKGLVDVTLKFLKKMNHC